VRGGPADDVERHVDRTADLPAHLGGQVRPSVEHVPRTQAAGLLGPVGPHHAGDQGAAPGREPRGERPDEPRISFTSTTSPGRGSSEVTAEWAVSPASGSAEATGAETPVGHGASSDASSNTRSA